MGVLTLKARILILGVDGASTMRMSVNLFSAGIPTAAASELVGVITAVKKLFGTGARDPGDGVGREESGIS
jgi:hypothetical protein